MPTSRKRNQPVSSSSDIRSSGGPATKHVNKRRRLEIPSQGSALAERSVNIASTPARRLLSKSPLEQNADVAAASTCQDPSGVFSLLEAPISSLSNITTNPKNLLTSAVLQGSSDKIPYVFSHSAIAILGRSNKSRGHPDLQTLFSLKSGDDIAKIISSRGWWTAELIELCSDHLVRAICLSSSVSALDGPSPLLGKFFKQGAFTALASLSLANIPLGHPDLAALRLLPALQSLNLASTGISTHHLLHLITHAASLQDLNISSNILINDDCRVPLAALSKMSSLHLRDTTVTMPCLRLLIYALPTFCHFITVPQGCLNYLNDRSRHYCQSIPTGYIQDPRHVADLTLPLLKKNLELHKRCNRDIIVSGGKAELVERLMGILCGRIADACIAKRIGNDRC